MRKDTQYFHDLKDGIWCYTPPAAVWQTDTSHVDKVVCDVLVELINIDSLKDLSKAFRPRDPRCECIKRELNIWREKIDEEIKKIKPFTAYL